MRVYHLDEECANISLLGEWVQEYNSAMQQDQPLTQHYGIPHWSDGYFAIGDDGALDIRLGAQRQALQQIALSARERGLDLPLLVRFPGILRDRARSLCAAFQQVSKSLGYQGKYQGIYPIKVNQQRTVIEEIVAGGAGCIGLEAGSKPELMAVLALSPPGGVIVCNGYKDREYIRLALIGRALGLQVYIVVEKPGELALIEAESAALDIEPLLGVRIRLATSASGNWQNSGGEKAKFGLTATQLLRFVEQLQSTGHLHWLQLLHSHIGSQIPNLRDIASGVNEAGRYYVELRKLGADIRIVDVGGGLGIDYEGTRSRHYCSINYGLESYARAVIEGLQRICHEESLPEPDLFSESGRALTAHHAVLITNIIDNDESNAGMQQIVAPNAKNHNALALYELTQTLAQRSPQEAYEEARYQVSDARNLFDNGYLDLQQWSQVEQLYINICHAIRPLLNPHKQRHRELLDQLNVQLAEKVFLNFSLFQSVPDVWAIEQIFPIAPLTRLHEKPARQVIVHDLTCDSDGCIEHYVDQEGVESTLPLHAANGEEYLLGIFLVGAYQEILGDMHNLFGDTHAINVEINDAGFVISEEERGDAIDELLRYVHFDTDALLASYQHQLAQSALSASAREAFYQELSEGLTGYTYHED